MTEYTPTTEQIRAWCIDDGGMAEYYDPINGHHQAKQAGIEFDRWLAEHDRKLIESAFASVIRETVEATAVRAAAVARNLKIGGVYPDVESEDEIADAILAEFGIGSEDET